MKVTNIDIRDAERPAHIQAKRNRVYIFPAGESIMDDLANRHTRPSKLYRKHVMPQVLEAMGLPADTKLQWSKYAGCSMCPCSPGFIMPNNYGKEVFVDIEG